jgi:hypothetical protein
LTLVYLVREQTGGDVRRSTIAALALSALALASCGSAGPNDARGTPSPDTPVSSTPEPEPSGPIKQGAQKVEPTPGMDDVQPSRFERVKVVDDDTLRVFFYQGVPPCSVLDRVDVEYGTQTVGLTLQIGTGPADEDTACIEIAVYNYVDVELDEPLDGRRVVDGAR